MLFCNGTETALRQTAISIALSTDSPISGFKVQVIQSPDDREAVGP
jgi:hypothetical protein